MKNDPKLAEAAGGRSARDAAQALDGSLHAGWARLTGGLSPISIALAGADWLWHLGSQPATLARLAVEAQNDAVAWWSDCLAGECRPTPHDRRFADASWQQWPFAPMVRGYEAAEAWWQRATDVRGMNPHHADETRFFARQWLDMLAPSNFVTTNPEVLQRTLERRGANLVEGWHNALDDWRARQGLERLQPLPPYRPGVELALTPGKVVHRNHLVELIQYAPQTPTVRAEPVFIVPSWIMKYYILDLSPHNSLVNWLVGQGHTVFIVSWRNPDEGDALLSMEDYLEQGVFDPLAAIARRVPGEPVHACGYCLGGTLLAIGAAALARPQGVDGGARLPKLASVSLLAAETDFSEPGELGLLTDEAQVALLEDVMAERGFLSGRQMAQTFQFLRSRDLIWSTRMREMLLGERQIPNDLMAWNADSTRMPAAMHSEYLRRCYLRNELAQGRYPVQGEPVALSDIRVPVFAVGTELDHVSPWRSVYKLHQLLDTELTFVLTNAGHNAGIVSEPGHANRRYRLRTAKPEDHWVSPDRWPELATQHEGSWWLAWHDWLVAKGSGRQVPARRIAAADAVADAPGTYVQMRYVD